MSEDRKYKDKTWTGRTYWEDKQGKRQYEDETWTGRKYREDEKGNRTYEDETWTGRKYREDEKGNRTYEDKIKTDKTWTGRVYEEKAGFFDNISKNSKSFIGSTSSSINFSGRTTGGALFGILGSVLIVIFVIIYLSYYPLIYLYNSVESTKNKHLLFILAPLKSLKEHFIIAYIMNSAFWSYIFGGTNFFSSDGLSLFWSIFLGFFHFLWSVVSVLIFALVSLVHILKFITSNIYGSSFWDDLYLPFLLILFFYIPYLLSGIIIRTVVYFWGKYQIQNTR